MTTAELSEKSGVPKGTLDKILSGVTRDPKLETLSHRPGSWTYPG